LQTCDDEVSHERFLPSGSPIVLDDIGVIQQPEAVNLKSNQELVRHAFMFGRIHTYVKTCFSSKGWVSNIQHFVHCAVYFNGVMVATLLPGSYI